MHRPVVTVVGLMAATENELSREGTMVRTMLDAWGSHTPGVVE